MIDDKLHRAFDHWLTTVNLLPNNKWLAGTYSRVYVRYFRGWIEIANVNVNVRSQRKGVFTNFLLHVEQYGRPIKIENVHNEYLAGSLNQRGGYVCVKDRVGIPCYYRE